MLRLVRYTAIAMAIMLSSNIAYANHHNDKCPKLTGNGTGKNTPLKLTIEKYHLSLNLKKPICIAMDKSVNVKINVPQNADHEVQPGDVTAVQKAGAKFKIEGDNSDDKDLLELTITPLEDGNDDDTDCGDEFGDECAKFWIKVKGVGELDPMVRVVEPEVLTRSYHDTLWDVLRDLDLTLEQAIGILELPYDDAPKNE